MKKKILVFLMILFAIVATYSQSWLNSLENAKKMALASNKLIFVDFTASWCGPCKMMDANVWSKEDVQMQMKNYVTVQIDIDINKDIANSYNIRSIPNLFILDPNGKIVENNMGYRDDKFMISWLKKYSINTSFLQNKLISFYKKPTYSSALRLADKYQIYSLYLDKSIKNKFYSVADEYFEIAFKLLKKAKVKNKKMLKQKIELFKLRKKAFQGKIKKLNKKLSKFDESSILTSNQSLFSFLNYITQIQNNKEEAQKWFDKMSEKDKKIAVLVLKEKL